VWRKHDQTLVRRASTLLDVMDHVLDKGVVVEAPASVATQAASTSHTALLDVTARVDITPDADDVLKRRLADHVGRHCRRQLFAGLISSRAT
jgi:hypothetical protein